MKSTNFVLDRDMWLLWSQHPYKPNSLRAFIAIKEMVDDYARSSILLNRYHLYIED